MLHNRILNQWNLLFLRLTPLTKFVRYNCLISPQINLDYFHVLKWNNVSCTPFSPHPYYTPPCGSLCGILLIEYWKIIISLSTSTLCHHHHNLPRSSLPPSLSLYLSISCRHPSISYDHRLSSSIHSVFHENYPRLFLTGVSLNLYPPYPIFSHFIIGQHRHRPHPRSPIVSLYHPCFFGFEKRRAQTV